MGYHERTLQIKYDDIIMKTDLLLTRFGETFGTLKFDENFFCRRLGFTQYWDYKPSNASLADSTGVCTTEKSINLSTIDKNHWKCRCIDGSVVKGEREPILVSFILDKPPGYKFFCHPERINYKKTYKCVWNTITFYFENDNLEYVSLMKKR